MGRSGKYGAVPIIIAVLATSISLGRAFAEQKADQSGKGKGAAPAAATPSDYTSILNTLTFRDIGPAAMGGRIDDFAAVESNPDIIYVGAATGGVFKTQNGGVTWEPVFDNEATSSIGAIA